MKYLVVDDEAAICQGTVQRLRRFLPPEDAVECAFCGEDAIRQIAGSPPDVLITDIRMGAMDGLDLIEAARRVRPDIACIIITAFDSFKYAQQAIKLEVKDYLVKPYGEGDLRAAVARIVDGLNRSRSQNRALLEKQLYARLLEGGRPEPELFRQAGLAEPPQSLRLVCWDVPLEPVPAWPGGWHFCDERRRYLLAADDRDALMRWLQSAGGGARFGVSKADGDLGALWRQAGQALRISGYENMPRWVFYQDEFSDEQRFRQNHAVLWAMNYISEHLGQPIAMDDVCSLLHLNYSYFSRQFKQQIGVSFSEYLLRRQMEWACERMRSGMRVNEAADVLGYRSTESFGKAFSRIYGSTPRNYLNQMRKENQE